ncbi:unnamed protein product [Pseudo-nitzschia multistriata]|uniref:Uncharacterized protein n=1 Tax=Pseudo-nitzschia multistriata TaxID=183589 RepID=A0A448Z130_9STRA|nr:unnamed protein product [Pseudo-nitzschia multistriata]
MVNHICPEVHDTTGSSRKIVTKSHRHLKFGKLLEFFKMFLDFEFGIVVQEKVEIDMFLTIPHQNYAACRGVRNDHKSITHIGVGLQVIEIFSVSSNNRIDEANETFSIKKVLCKLFLFVLNNRLSTKRLLMIPLYFAGNFGIVFLNKGSGIEVMLEPEQSTRYGRYFSSGVHTVTREGFGDIIFQ